jgi:hypothetical protein
MLSLPELMQPVTAQADRSEISALERFMAFLPAGPLLAPCNARVHPPR